MANYNYIIKNSYSPFSMQEMLTPLTIYKEAADKREELAATYSDKINKFKYLSTALPPDDPARKIYEDYANAFNAYSADFAKNGITMNNQRGFLELRNNYEGTIGQLYDARVRLDEEIAARNQARAKGIQMYYANDNPTISDYLYQQSPNTYGISHDDLRKRGLETAEKASSRIFSNTRVKAISDFYDELIQTQGYHPSIINAFKRDLSSIPELANEVEAIMNDTGAEQNLTGINKEMARQTVINALTDGIIYKEARDVKENPNHPMSEYQEKYLDMQRSNQDLTAALNGLTRVDQSVPSTWQSDPNASSGSGSSSSGTGKKGSKVPDWEEPRPDIVYDMTTGMTSEKLPDVLGIEIEGKIEEDKQVPASLLIDGNRGRYTFYKIVDSKGNIKKIVRKYHKWDKYAKKPAETPKPTVQVPATETPSDSTAVKIPQELANTLATTKDGTHNDF